MVSVSFIDNRGRLRNLVEFNQPDTVKIDIGTIPVSLSDLTASVHISYSSASPDNIILVSGCLSVMSLQINCTRFGSIYTEVTHDGRM